MEKSFWETGKHFFKKQTKEGQIQAGSKLTLSRGPSRVPTLRVLSSGGCSSHGRGQLWVGD